MQPVFRFAPSPNGHLHLGHAFSALLNARMARETGGRFLLRIEDIDTFRCTPQLVEDCLEDLAWLGLEWEEPVLRQSRETARYRQAAEILRVRGHIYPCFCTRGHILKAAGDDPARDPEGGVSYPGTCRGWPEEAVNRALAVGAPHAWRLDMAAMRELLDRPLYYEDELTWRETGIGDDETVLARPELWGDVVIVRKDIPTSYHLAVVLDDALQGVTRVVRGQDLYHATSIHRLLQYLFGLPAPVYHHHELIRDDEGAKLSKSVMSTPLRRLRAEGVSAADIRQKLGFD
jgi:glutamyl-Q tRNA(Asp) synthetase